LFAIPREHLGRARAWRNELKAEDETAANRCIGIAESIRARLARGSVPKREALNEAARAWRDDVPSFGRLKLEIEAANRRLVIRELRMGAAHHAEGGWISPEEAIVIFVVGFYIGRQGFKFFQELIAAVSLHALARRFERGIDNTDAAIRADLIALAGAAVNSAIGPSGQFQISVADGAWGGRMHRVNADTVIQSVRTFLPDA
jgi:hypothetical protein